MNKKGWAFVPALCLDYFVLLELLQKDLMERSMEECNMQNSVWTLL
jgi:hypothetical protein